MFPCPSPTPGACSNSCPSSWWCHPTISSSVVLFSHFQSFPASGSFPMSQFFASAKVLELQLQHQSFRVFFRIDRMDLLSVQGTLKSLFQHHSSKASTLQCSAFFIVQLSLPYVTTEKTIALTRWTFIGKIMSLLFNIPSRLVIPLSSKEQASFNFMATVTICSDFGAQENKVCHYFHCLPNYLLWSDGTRCHNLSFLNVEL